MTAAPLAFAPEVAEAIAARRPLVALESTIITHGMPFPANLDTARAVEAEVRAAGATPATMAVTGGRIRVGLAPAELDALAGAEGVRKLSRADLAVALSEGWTGATTVAATMICARLAGIEVFATGGIGGVHRGAESSFDISADLEELAQTPVTVVASGAKAILDLPKTLEVLETRGVPVIAFGQDVLPAFWSRDSGLPAPLRLDHPAAIARAHRMRARLGLPHPGEAREVDELVAHPHVGVEAALLRHVAEAPARLDVQGAAVVAHRPRVGGDHPEDDAHRGRLAGAVRAQEAHHLPGWHGDGEPVEGDPVSVPLGQLHELQHRGDRTPQASPRNREETVT